MKQYVVCIDGTWNLPEQSDTDPLSRKKYSTETNVLRVFRGLTGVSPDPRTSYGQTGELWSRNGEAIYFAGVGTEPGTKFYEGITGLGTAQRIMHAYQFLAARYRAGDRIFGFGFSRGAFAIRSLAGLIKYAGLPDEISPHSEDVNELYRRYGSRNTLPQTDKLDHRLREVHFLGL